MKLCDCGGRLEAKRLPKYEDKRLGLPGVKITLFNAVTLERCALCGRVEHLTIGNLEGLIATVAVTRVQHPARLTGGEILFLRKALEFTGKELGAKLDVGEGTISRWENDADPIGPQSEKLLRLLVGQQLGDRAPLIAFTANDIWAMTITPMHVRPLRLDFTLVEDGLSESSEELWKKGGNRRAVNG